MHADCLNYHLKPMCLKEITHPPWQTEMYPLRQASWLQTEQNLRGITHTNTALHHLDQTASRQVPLLPRLQQQESQSSFRTALCPTVSSPAQAICSPMEGRMRRGSALTWFWQSSRAWLQNLITKAKMPKRLTIH